MNIRKISVAVATPSNSRSDSIMSQISVIAEPWAANQAATHREHIPEVTNDGWIAEQAERARILWGAVLLNGLRDALRPDYRLSAKDGYHGSGTSPGAREDARRWIGSRGFRAVCMMAGFDPDYVEGAYRAGRIQHSALTPNLTRYAAGSADAERSYKK